MDLARAERLVLLVVAVLCAACSARGGSPTSTSSHVAASGPIGCLDPRGTASVPVGGWLPDTTGTFDYEPENTGAQQPPSARATLLGTRVRGIIGGGFDVAAVQEFATATCVVDRDVTLRDTAEDVAFVRVLQLRRPLNDGSFPLAGNSMSRQHLAHGAVILTNHAADDSLVTAVLARADGLVVELQVRSSKGQDTSGWPTTMPPPTLSQPARPSPVTPARAVIVTEDVATLAAAGI